MPGVQCDQGEEWDLKTVAQALLLGDNQQVDAKDGYLQQQFHRTVTAVENCTDADCMLLWDFALLPFGRPYTIGNSSLKEKKSLLTGNSTAVKGQNI